MLAGLFFLLWLDSAAQPGTLPYVVVPGTQTQIGIGGIGLLILLMGILPLAVHELAELFTAEKVRPYRSITSTGSALLVLHAFLTQFDFFRPYATSSLAFLIVFVMLLA